MLILRYIFRFEMEWITINTKNNKTKSDKASHSSNIKTTERATKKEEEAGNHKHKEASSSKHNTKSNSSKKKENNKNNSSLKFLIMFFGFFLIITIFTIVYKIPIHITDYKNINITKVVIEGKDTNEYLSIEDKNTIATITKNFDEEKFIRQNFGANYIGYNVYVYFYSENTLVDTIILHSNNLLEKNSTIYKSSNSKAIKHILFLLEEDLKSKILKP